MMTKKLWGIHAAVFVAIGLMLVSMPSKVFACAMPGKSGGSSSGVSNQFSLDSGSGSSSSSQSSSFSNSAGPKFDFSFDN